MMPYYPKIAGKSVITYLLFAFFHAGCAQPGRHGSVLIGFYNVENLFDTINQPDVLDEEFTSTGANRYTSRVYHDRLRKLSRVIAEMGADFSLDGAALLGLAEVENRSVLEDLVKMPLLKERNYHIIHVDGPDERGIDVALLYNPDYFKPERIRSLHVPTESLDAVYGFTRDVLFVSGYLSNEAVHVFVNHWPSRRGGTESSRPLRALSASVCRQHVDSLFKINSDAKIIVMGDFNDDPVDASITEILHAKGPEEELTKGDLFNPWMTHYRKGTGTMAYNGSWSMFDQIILSPAWLGKNQNGLFFKQAEIFSRGYMIQTDGKYKDYPKRAYHGTFYAGGYSDHFPAYIVLLKAVQE